jgi:hypothetical protein
MKIQIALTVSEAKRLIAKAVAKLPEVIHALEKGKVLLKGGTTVSAVAEELAGLQLRICGRITRRGTVSSKIVSGSHSHSIILEKGEIANIDSEIVEVVKELGRNDVIIISGNALDSHYNVAMMAGSVSGGSSGIALSGMMTEGAKMIIPIGLEKLIPGNIRRAIMAAGRKGVERSYGMATGLIPLIGKVITEKEAVEIIAEVSCTIIGRGGIMGGEGSTVMAVEGLEDQVEKVWGLVEEIKGADISGQRESLPECDGADPRCREHLACIYKGKKSQ